MGSDNDTGNHNVISLLIVKTLGRFGFWKVIAPFYCEFFGAMMLTMVVQLSVGLGQPLAALAIGSILMCMVFTYGHLSGGHYNPAVSLAVMIRGKISITTFFGYLLSQVIGGICGSGIGEFALDKYDLVSAIPKYVDGDDGVAFLLEFIFTFTLATTVLNTATTVSAGENSFYGLAIGFVIMCGAISVGDITGAVFNPAVGTGLLLIAAEGRGLWLYWVAPMLGGFTAGVMFHIINSDEDDLVLGEGHEIDVNEGAVGGHVSRFSMKVSNDAGVKDFCGRKSALQRVPDNIAES